MILQKAFFRKPSTKIYIILFCLLLMAQFFLQYFSYVNDIKMNEIYKGSSIVVYEKSENISKDLEITPGIFVHQENNSYKITNSYQESDFVLYKDQKNTLEKGVMISSYMTDESVVIGEKEIKVLISSEKEGNYINETDFEDLAKNVKVVYQIKGEFVELEKITKKLQTKDIFFEKHLRTNSVVTISYEQINNKIFFLNIVLQFFFLIITILSSLHLIKDEQKNITLYHLLGYQSHDIKKVVLVSFSLLCIILLCFSNGIMFLFLLFQNQLFFFKNIFCSAVFNILFIHLFMAFIVLLKKIKP